MNKVILIGRLTKDPDVRHDGESCYGRYTLAVDRKVRRDNNDPNAQTADFINCVTFNKGAQFAEKYLHKGMKIAVIGRIQTGKYTNRDGQTVYTTDVVAEEQEFVESKAAPETPQETQQAPEAEGGFVNIPDSLEGLPFK